MTTLAVLGGGKMGEALIGGLVAGGWAAADIAVAEVAEARRKHLTDRFPDIVTVGEPPEAVPGAEIVLVAVKPDVVPDALGAASGAIDSAALVLSIAAGVRIATLEGLVPGNPVVRVMPNTPALVGKGASAIAPGTHASDAHLDTAEEILGAVGIVVRLEEEALDAVTGLSGSGPAYVFYLAEALVEAGRAQGLSADVVDELVGHTLLGAATLLLEGGERPEDLRAAVTSPGGTTERAVALLDDRATRQAFVDAVAAATERSRELGGG